MKRMSLIKQLKDIKGNVQEDAYNILLHNEFTEQQIGHIRRIASKEDNDDLKTILLYADEALKYSKTVQQYAERLMKEYGRVTDELIIEIKRV